MESNKPIKNYTAADIEKYHAGKLTPAERNALEKAALEDPFLAEALEGYVYAKSPADDIAELHHRLAERNKGGKIISFPTWLRAAAMIIIVIGAGLLVYQFAFNDKGSDKVAMIKKNQENPAAVSTTSDSLTNDLNIADTISSYGSVRSGSAESKNTARVAPKEESPGIGITQLKDSLSYVFEKPGQPIIAETETKKDADKVVTVKDQPAALAARSGAEGYVSKTKNNLRMEGKENYFRGQIVDANNKPVPFASIINIRENAGTYSDAKGEFNLVSPDSVLEVQVRSIGYENNNAQLRNNISRNQVVMQNDNQGLNEVVISNKRLNSERSRDAGRKLEEPEPADGWENYDTYIVNNLKVPENISSRETSGEVELSFEVNNKGEPVNIKVEKSLCTRCDQEAIRLIKEGPKWKRASKRARTTVRVPF